MTSRQQDKQNLTLLERKLTEERKLRSMAEQQLSQERKAKKSEEAARQAALANRSVCKMSLLSALTLQLIYSNVVVIIK